MRQIGGLLALLALVLAQSQALGAEPTVALADYRAALQSIVSSLEESPPNLEAARGRAGTAWLVETPHGSVRADLSPLVALLDRGETEEALALAREHLLAAEATAEARLMDAEGVRSRLDRALQEIGVRERLQAMVARWWDRLFQRLEPSEKTVNWFVNNRVLLEAAILLIAAVGVAFFARGLYRGLSGYAGGDFAEGTAAARRSGRPATPEAMLREARDRSQAGEHKEALRLAVFALLRHLDRAGQIRYLPALTNREHERQLRGAAPDLARLMRDLNDYVEERLYSGRPVSAADFSGAESLVDRLWREGEALSRTVPATTGASSSAPSS